MFVIFKKNIYGFEYSSVHSNTFLLFLLFFFFIIVYVYYYDLRLLPSVHENNGVITMSETVTSSKQKTICVEKMLPIKFINSNYN